MKLLAFSAFAIALAVGPAAYAADEASCQQLFDKADADKNGTIAGTEVTPLAAAYKASDPSVTTADAELTITKEQFSAACMKDAFKDVALPQ
ncbi:MAG TPA: hypothetical protein VH933_18160 [Aestuariivirgaceae bacterium]|jgi:hypothetical protein